MMSLTNPRPRPTEMEKPLALKQLVVTTKKKPREKTESGVDSLRLVTTRFKKLSNVAR